MEDLRLKLLSQASDSRYALHETCSRQLRPQAALKTAAHLIVFSEEPVPKLAPYLATTILSMAHSRITGQVPLVHAILFI